MDNVDINEAARSIGRALESPFGAMCVLANPGFRFTFFQRWKIRFIYWIGCLKTAQRWILNKIKRGKK